MALFGFQFLYTAVLAVLLEKVVSIFSPGLKLISGYYRFIVPSDSDLKKFASNAKTSKDLRIPNDTGIDLQIHQTNRNDVAFLPYFNDFTWLIDFSIMAVLCFVGVEIYFQLGFSKDSVLHMGLIWIGVVLVLLMKTLFTMIKSYAGSNSGEFSVVLTLTSLALVISMICLIMDRYLDFGLNESFKSFDIHLQAFYRDTVDITNKDYQNRTASRMLFNGYLAIISTALAGLLSFPGLKAAQKFALLYKRKEGSASDGLIDQLISCFNFSMPFIVSILYLKPVKRFYHDRDYFTLKNDTEMRMGNFYDNLSPADKKIADDRFNLMRVTVILVFCFIRMLTFSRYMQAFLTTPQKELTELRKEVGFTKATKIQEEIRKVNLATCITAIQYIAPTLMVFFLTLSLIGLGDIRIIDSFDGKMNTTFGRLIARENDQSSAAMKFGALWTKMTATLGLDDDISTGINMVSSQKYKLSSLLKIFNPVFFQGVMNYLLWFVNFYLGLTSLLGLNFYFRKHSDENLEVKRTVTTKKVGKAKRA